MDKYNFCVCFEETLSTKLIFKVGIGTIMNVKLKLVCQKISGREIF